MAKFFESDSAEDLATKILDLMRNPARCAALCECSSEFIAQNNWDAKKYQYLDLVDRLIPNQAQTV